MAKVTLNGVKELLNDHLERSQTEIVENAKEKEELYKIAAAKGINVKDSRDLAIFKNVYALPDKANKNGAILPKKEFLKSLPGIVGKQVNLEHNRRNVVGFYIDYSFRKKDNKAITYGIFFKSNFASEWQEVKKAFKKKALNTSFEIYCSPENRKMNEDGTYELTEQEMAGGALLVEQEPAFDEAEVLNLAKKECKLPDCVEGIEKDLYFASNKEEIITAEDQQTQQDTQPQQPQQVQKPQQEPNDKKQDKPFGLQYYNFSFNCPKCKASIWDVEEENDEKAIVKCEKCEDTWELTFEQPKEKTEGIKNLTTIYQGKAHCPQCNTVKPYSYFSKVKDAKKEFTLECKKCRLRFPVSISEASKKKKISSIKQKGKEPVESRDNIDQNTIQGGSKEVQTAKKWSTKYVNNLPNSAFAVIEPAYKEGKTDDKRARHLPIKNKEGKLDIPHYRNALARVNQIKPITDSISASELRKKARTTLDKYKDRLKKNKGAEDAMEITKEKYREMLKKAASKIRDLKKASVEKASAEEKLKNGIKKTADQLKSYKGSFESYEKEFAEAKEELIVAQKEKDTANEQKEKVENSKKEAIQKVKKFYLENAKKVVKRREELGDYAKDLSDEEILDNKEYELAQLKKENDKLKGKKLETSTVVGDKNSTKDNGKLSEFHRKFREKVDKKIGYNKPSQEDK